LFFSDYADQLAAAGSDWSSISATNYGRRISFMEGLSIASDSPTGAYVGTFAALTIQGGQNRTLSFTLYNDTSLSSLTGRTFDNKAAGFEVATKRNSALAVVPFAFQPLTTVSQSYKIKQSYELK